MIKDIRIQCDCCDSDFSVRLQMEQGLTGRVLSDRHERMACATCPDCGELYCVAYTDDDIRYGLQYAKSLLARYKKSPTKELEHEIKHNMMETVLQLDRLNMDGSRSYNLDVYNRYKAYLIDKYVPAEIRKRRTKP